ncbi:MAG: cyclic nucleotide-binding domain-containing protein [Idiomarina sp.]|nr:cyclic nucleotide-binding domain-containing protein [Idiomarina sp.]
MRAIQSVSKLKLLEIMNRLDFFAEFSNDERRLLLEDKLRLYSCKQGRPITQQGETDTSLYLLLSGYARVEKDGQELGTLRSGEIIGEGSFVTRQPRSASVIASVDCIVFRIDNPGLRTLGAAIREKVKDAIIRGMAKRIVHLNERLELTRV